MPKISTAHNHKTFIYIPGQLKQMSDGSNCSEKQKESDKARVAESNKRLEAAENHDRQRPERKGQSDSETDWT